MIDSLVARVELFKDSFRLVAAFRDDIENLMDFDIFLVGERILQVFDIVLSVIEGANDVNSQVMPHELYTD